MKTVGDLIKAIEAGEKPILKVIGYVWEQFELDPGCLLQITKYLGEDGKCTRFSYNFDAFKDYNRKLLKKDWFGPGNTLMTAEEWGAWSRPNMGLFLGEENELLSAYGLELSGMQSRPVVEARINELRAELASLEKILSEL